MEDPLKLEGRELGPCRLEAVIGRGAMGAVYRARHLRLDRPVAVKVLLASGPEHGAMENLVREARLAARLEDPRIVQVYDAHREGSLAYIIMQLVAGETLEALVRRAGPLTPKRSLELVAEVLQGLRAAHGRGVVHRDLKPSNIMVSEDGRVRIADFGIAAASDESVQPLGTANYMAPEQLYAKKPEPAMDLYSLGATWYFALAGRPPYQGTAAEVLVHHRDAPVPDVRVVNREVTRAMAELIMRLMAKRPGERPGGAEKVLELLGAAGMTMEVDASGSPFRILPPPVEPRVGLAAERPAEVQEEAPAPARPAGPVPPPPPAPPVGEVGLSWTGLLAVTSLLGLLFGRHWAQPSTGDYLAGGAAAALALAGLFWVGGGGRLRPVAAVLLFSAMAGALLRYGLLSGGSPGLGSWIAAALSLACAAGGAGLGAGEGSQDRALAALLLLLGAAGGTAAAAGWGLPAEAASQRLAEDLAVWLQGGGGWRWTGVAAVLVYAAALRLSGARLPWQGRQG